MNQNSKPEQPKKQQNERKPNDSGSIRVEGHVRIFDPNTKQTHVEKRA